MDIDKTIYDLKSNDPHRDIELSYESVKKFADKRGITVDSAMDLIISILNED